MLFFYFARTFPEVSGSCLNPAIGLIPSLYNAIFYSSVIHNKIYVYIVAPLLGGGLGMFLFEFLYYPVLKYKIEN